MRAANGAALTPTRRSRHATTFLVRIAAHPALEPPCAGGDDGWPGAPVGGAQLDLFVKLFRPAKRLSALARLGPRRGALRVMRITGQLRARAFATPRLLLSGEQACSRRSLLVAARAEGEPLPSAMARLAGGAPERKWDLLGALGREVARLHRAGFVHGDLTPYNVLVVDGVQGRFVLLDHDRTLLPRLLRRRRQLRNLVQLGTRQFDCLTRADRMRFFRAYARALGLRKERRMVRRVNAMLVARRRRDRRRAARGRVDVADA